MSIFDDAWDTFTEPFEKIGNGDLTGLIDLGVNLTPIGFVYKSLEPTIEGIAQNVCHVSNMTNSSVRVTASPNVDWVIADITATIALLVASYGYSGLDGYQALKNAKTIKELYDATRTIRAAGALASDIWKIFEENSTQIDKGKSEAVNVKSISNPLDYLNPSQYAAIADGSDLSIILIREDGEMAFFNTNSDWSWALYPNHYSRVIKGTLWQPDMTKPVRKWNKPG